MTGPGRDFGDTIRDYGLLIAMVALWVVAGAVWLALFIGAQLAGTSIPGNPLVALLQLVTGRLRWPGLGASAAIGCELLIVTGLVQLWWRRHRDRARTRTRVDYAARLLGRGREIREYTNAGAAESAARLRTDTFEDKPAEHGYYLGETLTAPVQELRASWERVAVLFAGPRVGKTRRYVIRHLIEAPGAALVTTLRNDVWLATVDIRRLRGRVFNFDPQQLVTREEPAFWFDPLADVTTIDDARKLKDHFVAGARGANATTSAYFDGEGEQLLARLILAAAHKPTGTLTDVYKWVTDPNTLEPVELLKNAGQELAALALDRTRKLPDKQRDGVYGSAAALVNCLENPAVNRWVTPPEHDRIPRFDPDAFVRSNDTLYLHSREGEGNISPLIAALTQNVFDAGLRLAARSPGGRMPTPLMAILDEAANVCKIRNLPDLYSYLGGSGIPVITVLQSFEQGVEVWNSHGMRKLFDAANVRIYAGGLADPEFLRRFTDVLGPKDRTVATHSYDHQGHHSRSYSTQRDPSILDVSELSALPPGRAVILAAGTRPILARTLDWTETEHAEAIAASRAANNPLAA